MSNPSAKIGLFSLTRRQGMMLLIIIWKQANDYVFDYNMEIIRWDVAAEKHIALLSQ
jgi:hypothetical protein